jgi:hypothetical protein
LEEEAVTDQGRVMISAMLGATVGGLLGYLYLTESGRRVLDSLEPRLDDFMREFQRAQRTAEKARDTVGESWRSLTSLAGEAGRTWDERRSSSTH